MEKWRKNQRMRRTWRIRRRRQRSIGRGERAFEGAKGVGKGTSRGPGEDEVNEENDPEEGKEEKKPDEDEEVEEEKKWKCAGFPLSLSCLTRTI